MTQLPSPERGGAPIFGPCLLWPDGRMDQDGTWHGGKPLSRPYCARWGPNSFHQKDAEPQFSAHFYCCQTAGCINMPLGMEAGLSPGDFVLDGDPAPQEKGTAPVFGPYILRLHGCMYHDTTWYGGRPQPKRRCVRWGPSSPTLKGHSPQFTANVRSAKRLHGLK